MGGPFAACDEHSKRLSRVAILGLLSIGSQVESNLGLFIPSPQSPIIFQFHQLQPIWSFALLIERYRSIGDAFEPTVANVT